MGFKSEFNRLAMGAAFAAASFGNLPPSNSNDQSGYSEQSDEDLRNNETTRHALNRRDEYNSIDFLVLTEERRPDFEKKKFSSNEMQKKIFFDRLGNNKKLKDKIILSIENACTRYNQGSDKIIIPPSVMIGLIGVESDFDPKKVSADKKAVGLAQVRSSKPVFDVRLNIELGVEKLRYFVDRYQSLTLGLVAYNEGNDRLDKQLMLFYPHLIKKQTGSLDRLDKKKFMEMIKKGEIDYLNLYNFFSGYYERDEEKMRGLNYPLHVSLLECDAQQYLK